MKESVICAYLMMAIIASSYCQVINGEIDLANTSSEVVELTGDWDFYKGVLSPVEIGSMKSEHIRVFSFWPLGDKYKAFGYGLYHLKVKGAGTPLMAIRFERVHTSYKVWVDDKLVGQSGKPSSNPINATPGIFNQPIVFSPPSTEFNIYVAVSNYDHARGGILEQVQLGPADVLSQNWARSISLEILMVSVILAISLYGIVMFIINPKQWAYLYFGLFCIFSSIRLISIDGAIIGVLFPHTPYFLVAIFRYAGIFISAIFIALYVRELLPSMKRHWVVKLTIIISIICTVGVVLAPSWWGTYWSRLFQLASLLGFTVFYVYLVKEIKKGNKEFILVAISISCLIIAFVHDVFVFALLIPPAYWQFQGFTLAALVQTIFFARENKSLHAKIDSLYSNFVSFGLVHKQKDEFEKSLISELKEQLTKSTSDKEVIKAVLQKVRNSPSLPPSQLVVFENLDKINDDFLYLLKKRYPFLNQNDLELCISLRAKLSTKQIAAARNVNTDAVKKARSRLRAKLKLDKNTDLYTFFENFNDLTIN